MSRPKPPPPPRPDLEGQSPVDDDKDYMQTKNTTATIPPPKPSRGVPPPIPLRPDLGEGIDNNVQVPKIPPPVMEKKASHTKFQGRPEISIISAQPMTTPGIVSPPAPTSQELSYAKASPGTLSHTTPPPATPSIISPIAQLPGAYSQPTSTPGNTSPIVPPPITVHSQPTRTPNIISPIAPPPTVHSQPTMTPNIISPIVPPPTVHSQPTAAHSIISPIAPPPSRQAPTVPSKPSSPLLPSPSSTGSPSPNKVQRTPKSREPPQRPKSKPVFELPVSGEECQGSVGVLNTSIVNKHEESPLAPKRKKNKPNKSKASFGNDFDPGFGINNSAFFENELDKQEDVQILNNGANETVASTKTKTAPTVIRAKPNGKDNLNTTQDPFHELDSSKTENVTPAKTAKPTVIKPPTKFKPPPVSKKAIPKQDESTTIPTQVAPVTPSQPEAPSKKPKNKPTVIIPKAKKDPGIKNEKLENKTDETSVVSPSDKLELEAQRGDFQDKKTKTKRIPNIIRPNKLKKDTSSQGDNVAAGEGFRGTPEGESQESSQNQVRKGPVRKAPPPPRPSPPKQAPGRPGPPKRAPEEPKALIESSNLSVKFEAHPRIPPSGSKTDQVKENHVPEVKHKAKRPRPATIGKDKDSEEHKSVETKKEEEGIKKPAEPVVSSVVSTKIEPSAIALYDYIPTNIDDLSFKAGDEIFLIKRVSHEWYIGRCGDCEGMMPVKFVEIIEDLPPETSESPSLYKASPNTSESLSTFVLYDFHAQSRDELTLFAGDTVQLLEMVNDEWIKGKCNEKIGIFPANFVDINEDIKHKLLQQKQNSKPEKLPHSFQGNFTKESSVVSSGPRCKAVYDYDSGNPNDLKFGSGDVIQITERINSEWLKGKFHGTTGMFPAAYVDIIEDLVKNVSSSFPVTTALHEYISHAKGDLSFKKGDIITVVGKINEDWLEGELNGQRGIFPSTFVELVEFSGLAQHPAGHHLKPQDNLLPKGKALYDFTAEADNELTFKAGDEIILLKYINEEWMEGEMNDQIGQFPVAFIEVLVPLP